MGLETIAIGKNQRECIKLVYADDDTLFVSIDRLNRVQKYSSESDLKPKLTKLGSGDWEKAKYRTKESVKKIAADLIQMNAARKTHKGFAFSEDTHWQRELEASFTFEETEDQLRSIFEVKNDLEKSVPMDRLLCGDVGYGKTEVALRAAFKVIMDGRQVALLVPTTILAFQHFHTFKERMRIFPINLEMLSRFRSIKEQNTVLSKLEKGGVDLIIGTHRLLSDDVKFKDLGLLIIDEEQRFGVTHKEKLKKIRTMVDILTMTATPIPRTLHLALMGARELSHIETPPRNRLPVITEIHEWDDELILQAITREIDRGGQVYFVHNRVQTIDGIRRILEEMVPNAKIAVAHGQLPEKQLEKIMLDFINKKYDVLVSTMIIENGLDIPNVNTLIIDKADKFGLAQLYQLRGRVGRSNEQAYAYLVIPPLSRLTSLAQKRLRAIQDFTDLGSGFKVALRDLEIRGIGNILGKEQSGNIQSVGFELYCKILNHAVNNLKAEMEKSEESNEREQYTDPKIDVDFDLVIPHEYIYSEPERVTIYHRLVNFQSLEDLERIREELRDRFGPVPDTVINLINAIEIKILAGKIFASRVIVKSGILKLHFTPLIQKEDGFFKKILPNLMNQKKSTVQFMGDQDNPTVQISLTGNSHEQQIIFAKNMLKSLI
jgi:transcription-repair coupling factor (superfamily II helicase)